MDTYGLGAPPNAFCETTDPITQQVSYKISVACTLGQFVNALGWSALALLYEVLSMLKTVLTSFAIPSFSTSIKLPAFVDTLHDLEVAACSVAGAIASLVPVSFSCSAQTAGTDPSTLITSPPLQVWRAIYCNSR